MDICQILSTPYPPREGIGNFVHNLTKHLISRGNRVTVITRGNMLGDEKLGFEGAEVIRASFLPIYPFHIYLHSLHLERLVRNAGFDIIHVHSPLCPAVDTGSPVVTTVHTTVWKGARMVELIDLLSLGIKLHMSISYHIEKKLFKTSDLITTVSMEVARELEVYDIALDKVLCVGNGVDPEYFQPNGDGRREGYVLYVGRLSHRKGLLDLVSCAKQTISIAPEIKFLIVGSGPLHRRLKFLIRKLGMENSVRIFGYVNKEALLKLYQQASVFVLPSLHEGLPTVLLEAMACSTPVVATAAGGTKEVITNGVNGILVPPKQPGLLSDAILRIIRNDELASTLAYNARRTVQEKYSFEIIADRILDSYSSIIAG